MGEAGARIERAIGAPALFVNGAVGDVSPRPRGWTGVADGGAGPRGRRPARAGSSASFEPGGLQIATEHVVLPLADPRPPELPRRVGPDVDDHRPQGGAAIRHRGDRGRDRPDGMGHDPGRARDETRPGDQGRAGRSASASVFIAGVSNDYLGYFLVPADYRRPELHRVREPLRRTRGRGHARGGNGCPQAPGSRGAPVTTEPIERGLPASDVLGRGSGGERAPVELSQARVLSLRASADFLRAAVLRCNTPRVTARSSVRMASWTVDLESGDLPDQGGAGGLERRSDRAPRGAVALTPLLALLHPLDGGLGVGHERRASCHWGIGRQPTVPSAPRRVKEFVALNDADRHGSHPAMERGVVSAIGSIGLGHAREPGARLCARHRGRAGLRRRAPSPTRSSSRSASRTCCGACSPKGRCPRASSPCFSATLHTGGPVAFARTAQAVAGAGLVVLCAVCALGMALARFIVSVMAPGWRADAALFDLAVTLTRVMFPYLLLVGLAALAMGVLNAHHRFFTAALAPAVPNVAMIVAVLGLSGRMTPADPRAGRSACWRRPRAVPHPATRGAPAGGSASADGSTGPIRPCGRSGAACGRSRSRWRRCRSPCSSTPCSPRSCPSARCRICTTPIG